MVLNHKILRYISGSSFLVNRFTPVILFSFSISSTLAIPSFVMAENTYGPVKNGETLFKIAKKNQIESDSVSVEQLSLAIFNLNPDAFISGNMNLLKKGVLLNIPDAETSIETSSSDAKVQIRNHLHALKVIRVDAKQLKIAKQKAKKDEQLVSNIQHRLNQSRQFSKPWNKLFKQLAVAKKNHKKSKRKVATLSNLLLEKVTSKYTAPVKKLIAPPKEEVVSESMKNVDKRLTNIQASLDSFNQSNLTLIEKVAELSKLNDRVKILEENLGATDELVVQLKSTLVTMQQSIDEQGKVSEKLAERFDELKSSNQAALSSIEKKSEDTESSENSDKSSEPNTDEQESVEEDTENNDSESDGEKDKEDIPTGTIEDYLQSSSINFSLYQTSFKKA